MDIYLVNAALGFLQPRTRARMAYRIIERDVFEVAEESRIKGGAFVGVAAGDRWGGWQDL